VNAQLSLGWMGDGSDGAFACRNAPYKIRDRTSHLVLSVLLYTMNILGVVGDEVVNLKRKSQE
jgi:hypothetical protein